MHGDSANKAIREDFPLPLGISEDGHFPALERIPLACHELCSPVGIHLTGKSFSRMPEFACGGGEVDRRGIAIAFLEGVLGMPALCTWRLGIPVLRVIPLVGAGS